MSSRIYLDYASLTPVDRKVLREMKEYSRPEYANPSSLYKEGVAAKRAMAEARNAIADSIHAHSDEIIFTSGGTEANTIALQGVVRAAREAGIQKPHIVISNIEHSSVMETAAMLEGYGCEVKRVAVDHRGHVSAEDVAAAIKESTVLVSVMLVNNEIGTVQPIREIAKVVRKAREVRTPYPLLHTDAAQAIVTEDVFVEKLGVDLLTLDGSKMYGPRGIGCLYVKRGVKVSPVIYGGGQERGLRSGTENLPAIMGLAKAVEMICVSKGRESQRLRVLKDQMLQGLKEMRSDIQMNGSEPVAPHILNVSIPGIDSELFVLRLDAKGVACSTKSSCLRDAEESYVLKTIGADSSRSVRFSFGRQTTERQVKKALKAIKEALELAFSPAFC